MVGGVAALHLDAVLDWLTRHRRAVLAATLAGAVAMEVLYFTEVGLVLSGPTTASDAVQPRALQLWAVPDWWPGCFAAATPAGP